MLSLELQDKIPCSEIRKITKIFDIIVYVHTKTKVEMDRTMHTGATKERERIKRRPSTRWQDDIAKEGTTWNRKVLLLPRSM